MKKRLIFEVEEGTTKDCEHCKFGQCKYSITGEENWSCQNMFEEGVLDCEVYDLSTLKFIGEEDR